MRQWPPDSDDALLIELGAALRGSGPVSEQFIDAALAAYSWRTIDAELAVAELIFDSATDREPAALTRSAGTDRTLTFRSGPVVIAIEVTASGIVGQLSPAGPGRISARSATGQFEDVPVDEVGFFSMGVPPAGPVQLRATSATYKVRTCWVSLR